MNAPYRLRLFFIAILLCPHFLQSVATAADPFAVAEAFYAELREHRVSGLPQGEAWDVLAPRLSPELVSLLKAAQKEQTDFIKANLGEKPPWIEGDLFSSLFEGPQTFQLGQVQVVKDRAEVPVTCSHSEGGDATVWTDTLVLAKINHGWLIDDVRYGGEWQFANTGTLKDALRPAPDQAPTKRTKDWLPPPDTLVLPVQGSVSPDGRYAMGWGYEKGPVDWKKLAHLEEAHSGWGDVTFSTKLAQEPLDPALEDDANFLLDLRTHQPLCKLGIHYPGERPHFNHQELNAVWSPSSTCVVIIVTAKWETEFAHFAMIRDGICHGSHDMMEPLCQAAKAAVLKTRHPAAKRLRNQDDFMYSIGEVHLQDDGSFTAEITGQLPKQEDDFAFFEVAVAGRLVQAADGQSISFEALKTTVVPAQNSEPVR